MKKIKVVNNSPVVMYFALVSALVLALSYLTQGRSDTLLFSVYRSSLLDPLTYIRFFGHALGHANLDHYLSNMMFFVLVGPMLEEKYGSKDLLIIILVTSFVTGLSVFVFMPHTAALGASGVVFALILLASFTEYKEGTIPASFLAVAVLYLGKEFYSGLTVKDNISNTSHIIGGIVGAAFGFMLNVKNRGKK